MKTSAHFHLTGPCGIYCGIYCGDCGAYKVKSDSSLIESLSRFGWNGTPCDGCRPVEGQCQYVDGVCATYGCAAEHQVDFCYQCGEFPCDKLNPASDKAAILPHNLKLFNLCCIQKHGLDKMVEMQPEVKNRYFRGKMVIGQGPQLQIAAEVR